MNFSFLDHRQLQNVERALLLLLDTLCFALATLIAQLIRFLTLDLQPDDLVSLLWPMLVIVTVNTIFDLYRIDLQISPTKMRRLCLSAACIAFLIVTLVIYLMGADKFVGQYYGRGVLLGSFFGYALLSILFRSLVHSAFSQIQKRRRYLVLTSEVEFQCLCQESRKSSKQENFDLLTSPYSDLEAKPTRFPYVAVIVGAQAMHDAQLITKLMEMKLKGLSVIRFHDFFESAWLKVPALHLEDHWFVLEEGFALLNDPTGMRVKRVFDLLISVALIVLFSPLALLAVLAIKLDDRGPVIYAQRRTGKHGATFTLYKFRSMNVDAEKGPPQWAQKKDSRVTRAGRILRTTRMDELPQLWNVLKGDMSFIGPRPERPEFDSELEKAVPYYNLRHLLKPGITGWAQVLYPYGASVDDALEKLQYDLFYLKNYSLLLDLSIAFRTIRVVLFGNGSR